MSIFREDSPSSMTRVLAFLCVVTAIALAFSNVSDKLMLVSIFLGAGITGKVTQKIIEVSKKGE